MAFHIRDPETDAVVRALAKEMGTSMTEAIRITARDALRQARQRCHDEHRPFIESIRDIQEEIARFPKTGLKADKAFFDRSPVTIDLCRRLGHRRRLVE